MARDPATSLGHGYFHTAYQGREQGKAFQHFAKQLPTFGTAGCETIQCKADAEPGGQGMTALHPAEHPRDRAEIVKAAVCSTPCGTRPNAGVLPCFRGRGLLVQSP